MSQLFGTTKDILTPIDQCSDFFKIQSHLFGAPEKSLKNIVQVDSKVQPVKPNMQIDAFGSLYAADYIKSAAKPKKDIIQVPEATKAREIKTNYMIAKSDIVVKEQVQIPQKDFKTEEFEKQKKQFDDMKKGQDEIRNYFLQQRLKSRNQ